MGAVHRDGIARYNFAVRHPAMIALVSLLAALTVGFSWDGPISRLRRELESDDASRRQEVVRMLASHPADQVADLVLAALSDPELLVRIEAADAAGRLRLQAAVDPLLEWMDDVKAEARAAAGRALGRIGDRRALAPLLRALGDSDGTVRRVSVEALGTMGGTEAWVALVARLDDADATVRVATSEALGRLGDPQAVLPLIGRVDDESPDVRVAVYRALASLGDPRAVPALVHALRGGSEEARLAAIAALGRLGDPGSIAELERALDPTEPRVARAIVAALGRIDDPRALRRVFDATAHPELRALAIESLVHSARRARISGRSEHAAAIGNEACAALENAATAPQATALTQLIVRLLEEEALDDVPSALAPILLHKLREKHGSIETLLRALALTGTEAALLPLLEHLESPDPSIRAAALDSLELLAERRPLDGRSVDPLLAALGRVPPGRRAAVVRLLGSLGERRALPALRPLLESGDVELRRAVVQAIGALGDPSGADALLPLLDDADARTRFEAAHALARSAHPDALEALAIRLTRAAPADRHVVLVAIGGTLRNLRRANALSARDRDRARALLVDVLREADRRGDRALAHRSLGALARWGDPSIASALEARGGELSAETRRQIPRVLGALRTKEAHRMLLRLATSDDRAIATAATGMLGEYPAAADPDMLVSLVEKGPWPIPGAAAFSIARRARRAALPKRLLPRICRAMAKRDPVLRANLALALAANGQSCPPGGGPTPHDWLVPAEPTTVRVAAVRWLFATAPDARTTLEPCAEAEVTPEVAAACREPALPPLGGEADVYAYAPDGKTLREEALLSLRLSDGSVLLAYTDANGHLWLDRAPRGDLSLDDPVNSPLEP